MPRPQTAGILNALSFDIEDWFHLVAIDAVADPAGWSDLPSIVVERTRWILDVLEETGVHATFFVLGWVAERHPELPRMIGDRGHELGTHAYWHRRVDEMTPAAFAEELRLAIDVVEQPAGRKVLGFRAPSFSIRPGTEWAFDVLHDVGLRYDSSLFPGIRDYGGYPCPQTPHEFRGAPSGRPMPELPISVLKLGPLGVPFSGGGYLRFLHWKLIRFAFDRFHRAGMPVVVYLHPRDFAPDGPRVPMPPRRKFQSYVGLRTSERKLRKLLATYRFGPCSAVLDLHRSAETSPMLAAAASSR